jgi:hypothetical protein
MKTKSIPQLKYLLLVPQNIGITCMKSSAMHLNCFQGICGRIIEVRESGRSRTLCLALCKSLPQVQQIVDHKRRI